jgi:hypothetical protein
MNRLLLPLFAGLLLPFALLLGGCNGLTLDFPGGSVSVPGLREVTVEVVNDSDFEIDPGLRHADDSGFWAGLWSSNDLSTGTLAPGESRIFAFDCDQLGQVQSDEPEQFVGDVIYRNDGTRAIERDRDYHCRDRIQFEFVGNADSFGVVVRVNGQVVD